MQRDMQQIKDTKQIGDLQAVVSNSEKLADSLADVIDVFRLKMHFGLSDSLKTKGYPISSLLTSLVILPFAGVASVYAMLKHDIGRRDLASKKDAYYDAKNNENIDWRKLLMQVAKQFNSLLNNELTPTERGVTAIIFDDSLLEKTGKKIEKLSLTFDHVSKSYICGFKLLVCGIWDGLSFIPLDFSVHREKGTKHEVFADKFFKTTNELRRSNIVVEKLQEKLSKQLNRLTVAEQVFANKSNNSNTKKLEQVRSVSQNTAANLLVSEKNLIADQQAQKNAYKELKQFYAKGRLFGLTKKERNEQFKKLVSAKSQGFKRRKEADKSKTDMVLAMLSRVVKNGFVPRYVLTDSWFFSEALVVKVKSIKKGMIDLVSMVRINNQIFTDCAGENPMNVKSLLKINVRNTTRCKKLRCNYIKIKCKYKGVRVNLFYVKMGMSSTWHLLATTDLNLNFIRLMEIYQIRWSIEVFFKECKQYLNLGQCKSSNFDAQIADTTITMVQYIMLTYCKRINCQMSLGGLFKELHDELIELSLVNKLLNLFWELVQIFSASSGCDLITIQQEMMQNQEIYNRFIKLIPDKVFKRVA
jgi:hypothetical protein